MIVWRLFSLSVIVLFFCDLHGMDAKKQLEPVDEFSQTELHKFSRDPNGYKLIQATLLAGYDPDQKDIFGNTPLDEACDAGVLLNVICLLNFGANFNDLEVRNIKNGAIRDFFLQLRGHITRGSNLNDALIQSAKSVFDIKFVSSGAEFHGNVYDVNEENDEDEHGLFLLVGKALIVRSSL